LRLPLLAAALSVFAIAQNQSGPPQDTEGWRDLLPDPSFKNWTRLPLLPTRPMSETSQWKVDTEARTLLSEGDKGHEWLRYDQQFANFLFHVEWRFIKTPDKAKYNSGIYFRNNLDGWMYHQAQIGVEGYIFAITPVNGVIQRVNLQGKPWPESSASAFKALSISKENRLKDLLEWNTYDVRCDGKKITMWVNGGWQSEYTECEVPKGYVGLESEGHRIEFRNIKLKELP
jgi:hypothetical protein